MSAPPPRLPLRLERPPKGGAWSLEWQVADGSLVLPGETLCMVRGDGEGQPVPLCSPAPGRLHHIVPSVRHLSPQTIVGEIEHGMEFEQSISADVSLVRRRMSAAAAPDDPTLRRSFSRRLSVLRLEEDRLRRDLRRLRQGLKPQPASSGQPGEADHKTRKAAAQLLEALRAAPPEPVPSPLSSSERSHLMDVIGNLRAGLVSSGRLQKPPQWPREIEKIHVMDALERLFLARAEECRARTRGFPRQLQEQKLGLWQDLKDAYLRYIFDV